MIALGSTPKTFGLKWLHWMVVLLSLLLTFTAWQFSKIQLEEKARQRFDFEADRLVAMIVERMQKYEDALRSGVAALHSQSSGIDVNEWKRFSDSLKLEKKYPGINGIGVIYQVMPDELDAFLAKERIYRPDFHIHPPHEYQEYWPITYIEPVAPNAQAVGLDMAFEANRYEAVKKARDTDQPQITAPIILVQDEKKTPGFLFFVPFYALRDHETPQLRRETFEGVVYAPYIMEKLMNSLLENKSRLVSISIKDGENLMYDEHHSQKQDYDRSPLFFKQVLLDMYGRPWNIDIRSSVVFRDLSASYQPYIILVGGIVIDIILLSFFILLTRSNKYAVNYARHLAQHNAMIFDAAPDGIMSVSERGEILSGNRALFEMFGYEDWEMIGQSVGEVITEWEMLEHDALDCRAQMASGCHKSGHNIPLEISFAKTDMSDGDVHIIASVKDISQRLKSQSELHKSQQTLQLIMDNNPDIIFVKDTDFRVIQANERFMSLYPPNRRAQVLGRSGVEDYSSDEAEQFLAMDRKAFEEGYVDYEETIAFPNGQTCKLYTQKIRYEDSSGTAFILCIGRDMTGRERLIERLTESNEELERFAYVASHDLQEPLRMVTNFTMLLKRKYGESLDEEATKYIDIASSSAMRMQELIDDLLEYAKLSTEEKQDEWVDVNQVFDMVLDNLAQVIGKSQAEVTHTDFPDHVRANKMRLMRVLQNLLSNAIKYQPEGQQPKVHVSVGNQGDEWLFVVSDNGIGMKQEYCDQIFLPFNRLHSKGAYSGTGIGLAICRKIIESMNGEIWAESEIGNGSRFSFTIPTSDGQ